MAKSTVVKMKKRAAPAPLAELGPGIHAARIQVRAGDRYEVTTLAGERVSARLGEEVDAAFAIECLSEQRTGLVTAGEGGEAVILGALQTGRAASRDEAGTLRARGTRVEIDADEALVLRVGKSSLVLDKRGVVKVTGQKVTMNVAEVVRILSALCELP